ncbi:MAG TPA: N-6 DNA methylase, partial [Mesotoga infera]|nr:N-6 DNA methylase [Mesotoga infera]
MSTTVKSKYDWFGVLKMSGLLVSEVIYRDHFDKAPGVTKDEYFKLRKHIDRFNSESYTVNDFVKALLFDNLNHDPNIWIFGTKAGSFSVTESDHGERLSPDFILLSEDRKTPGFIVRTLAKDRELDKRQPAGSGTWRASEHIKFEALLRLLKCPVGLLTNGNEFRLVYVEEGLSTAYISWKQSDWLEEQSTYEAFRNLLNAGTLLPAKKKGLQSIIKESHEKQAEVTDALADQVYLVINKILDYINQSNIDVEPDKIYEAVIKVVMRLVFILYAEENSLLPHGFPEYDDNYGLIYLANALESERASLGETDFDSIASYRFDGWYRILALFNLIYYGSGHQELNVTAHGGDLFSPEGVLPLLKRVRLSNRGVRDILHDLLYMKGLRLSYAAIDVEQIGYVYEGLLGYSVTRASEPLVVTAKEKFVLPLSELERRTPKEIKALLNEVDSKINNIPDSFPEPLDDSLPARVARYAAILAPEDERLIAEGSYYMSSSGARKSTGSYYTPKQLTTYLVKETLGPLCVDEEKDSVKSSSEILSMKIVDPAMGSGAFLVQATNFIADKLLKAWEIEGKHTDLSDIDREILARRSVVEHCIYGVDINPTAVELAKMSLWLNTFSKDKPFTFLDHKLKCGNSLVGVFHGWEDTSVIPPEVYKASNNVSKEWKATLSGLKRINSQYRPTNEASQARLQSSMFSLTGTPEIAFARITKELAEVSYQIDVTGKETEDYFAKEKVYRERFLENRDYGTERLKADLWVAQWFANEIDSVRPLTTGELQELYQQMDKSMNNRTLLLETSEHLNWVEKISAEERFFHWKLEFPDVFEAGGFDAVIGNPP